MAGPVAAVEPQQGGHINESHVVVAGGGRYLLQQLNPAVFADPDGVMANILVVTAHLRSRGEPTLTVLLTDEGRPHWRGWRMYELVEGARPAQVRSPVEAEAVGRCVGRFHRALADLDPSLLLVTMPSFHDPVRRLAGLEALDPAEAAEAAEEVAALRELRHLAEIGSELNALPLRIAHNDAKVDNVLVDEHTGEPVMLVDLDTVMPGGVLWDVGDLVRSATATAAEDDPAARFDGARHAGLMEGWLAETGGLLSAEERALLDAAGPVVTYEQAVRFLTDHLAGDVYYRVARRGQNLDRARSQLALLHSMLAAPKARAS